MSDSAPVTSASVEPYLRVREATTPAWLAGGQLAYLYDGTGVPQVWVTEAGRPRQLTDFEDRIGSLLAAPAGNRVVLGKDTGGDERHQLWTVSLGESPRALTVAPGVIHAVGAFSPDGRLIAFASNARDQRYFDVWTLELDDPGSARLVFAADAELMPFAWSPDGRALVVGRSNTQLDHDLLLVPADGGEAILLTPHTGEATILTAAFAPEGGALYLISNQDRDFAALVRLDLATRVQTALVALEWDVEALAVAPRGGRLAYAVNEDGVSRVMLRDLATGEERAVTGLPSGVASGLTWSPDGDQLAFSLTGPQHPSDVWAAGLDGAARRMTDLDVAGLDRATFVAPETIRYPTFDGRKIPALWYRPREGDGPWPVVVDVHGGPEGQRRVEFTEVTQFLLARGFAVLAPNVRGSTGYGKTYCHLDDVERRMDAVADLAAAVDWLRRQPDVAADKIAVYGGSYGGFMVLAALTTYPDHWAAGVDVVGIANFVTFLENTGPWRRRLRATEYGDPERDADLLRRISPIHKAEQITAPLLVIHGRNDPRVPLGEAEQIVARLRALDRDVSLLVFDDEGHGLVKLKNRLVGYGAVAEFLCEALGVRR